MKAATRQEFVRQFHTLFQSTPPVKAATFAVAVNYIFRWIISIHAAREGGDVTLNRVRSISGISIHAAREGGDIVKYSLTQKLLISIHAAREGGDFRQTQIPCHCRDFNPRRP